MEKEEDEIGDRLDNIKSQARALEAIKSASGFSSSKICET